MHRLGALKLLLADPVECIRAFPDLVFELLPFGRRIRLLPRRVLPRLLEAAWHASLKNGHVDLVFSHPVAALSFQLQRCGRPGTDSPGAGSAFLRAVRYNCRGFTTVSQRRWPISQSRNLVRLQGSAVLDDLASLLQCLVVIALPF